MRALLFSLTVLFTFNAIGQKYALIDRNFKQPILFTDSVTINQVSKNYFPVRVSDLDTLLNNITFLADVIKSVQRAKFKSYKLKSGNTYIQINSVPHAYGDTYDILFVTSANNINAEYLIADNKDLNNKAVKNLKAFKKFIKNDKDIVINEFIEYVPVMYDATVYISPKN